MSFINKSVNYSTTVLLKQRMKDVLTSYEMYLQSVSDDFTGNQTYYLPNNGNKFYLFVTPKTQIESSKDDYFICHFFNNKSQSNDFYMEVNNIFTDVTTVLLEGYMYKNSNDNKQHYLLTDILYLNGEVVTLDFVSKHVMMESLVSKSSNLNNHLHIKVHPYFNQDNQELIDLFMNNFIFRDQIQSLEKIVNTNKVQILYNTDALSDKTMMKRITKTKYSDVYNVYNTITNEKEGILYVKGLEESKYILNILVGDDVDIECQFNEKFNKWQPVL
jgi:hypothetical protein